ncbi:putative glutamine synthetase [Aspergillus saccharolyticus JOP 1030-1]|uniref:Glutamine synthetase n=1 Tax=Aspergillus saccharolyticus JOP 1030-1 TaxID=1450539 RepID=A0A318Z7B8_9EURO|nr:putative glutamine synthetase [Aspergillus saccharolyticus JOP 1030-1]PYH43056.1 putative glutamine synthetase [Aspergillus saccharolyticus JOP 1030-1]
MNFLTRSLTTPSAAAETAPSTGVEVLIQIRQQYPDIQFLRFQWQDYSGVLRARVVLLDTAIAQLTEGKPMKATGLALTCSVDNHLIPGTPTDAQYWLVPDWTTLHPTVAPGSAQVLCSLDYTLPGQPMTQALCPRHTLARVLEQAQSRWNLSFLVGFEVEFVIMKPDPATGKLERYSRGWGLFSVGGLRDPCYQHIEQCVLKLHARGVDIQAIHTEGVRGQYEFALGPKPPMQAVDQLILVHSYLKDTFTPLGCTVTMTPKPVVGDSLANGQHTHLSLQPASPQLEASFLAGMLKRLPSLCSFCLPQDVSYERLKPFVGGADAVCWGTECRLVPVRKIEPSRWEIRCIDAMANMYLTLAAIIGAGLMGLNSQEPLVWPDLGDPANATAAQGEPLPKTLDEALDVLEADAGELAMVLGRPIIDLYVKTKRFEVASLAKLDPGEVRELFLELY